MKPINAVMIFVFDKEKNLLLLKRADNNKWEPVKGGINEGESWADAAAREVLEETGQKITNPKLVDIVFDTLDTAEGKNTKIKGHVCFCYINKIMPPIVIEEEHIDYKWIKYDSIPKEKLYPPLANKLMKIVIQQISKTK